jgi:hypothetical protein
MPMKLANFLSSFIDLTCDVERPKKVEPVSSTTRLKNDLKVTVAGGRSTGRCSNSQAVNIGWPGTDQMAQDSMNDHSAWAAPLSFGIERLMCDTGRFVDPTNDENQAPTTPATVTAHAPKPG